MFPECDVLGGNAVYPFAKGQFALDSRVKGRGKMKLWAIKVGNYTRKLQVQIRGNYQIMVRKLVEGRGAV